MFPRRRGARVEKATLQGLHMLRDMWEKLAGAVANDPCPLSYLRVFLQISARAESAVIGRRRRRQTGRESGTSYLFYRSFRPRSLGGASNFLGRARLGAQGVPRPPPQEDGEQWGIKDDDGGEERGCKLDMALEGAAVENRE